MSVFNDDIIETPVYVRNIYDIEIQGLDPNMFYKHVWIKNGLPNYPKGNDGENWIKKDIFYDILINVLGDIPAQVFERWVEDFNLRGGRRYIHKYFKKIIKRDKFHEFYIEGVVIENRDGLVIHINDNGLQYFSGYTSEMKIVFLRKE